MLPTRLITERACRLPVCLVAVLLSLVAARAVAAAPVSTVGSVTRDYVDDHRSNWSKTGPRPLTTIIWYPTPASDSADSGTRPTNSMFMPLPPLHEGAPLSPAQQSYPLVVLSHGTGGSALGLLWFGYSLASHGYIVAAVNHHGNTGAEPAPDARGFFLWWERAKDLSAVLDKVLSDPLVGSHVDRERIGIAGFSLGGYTVITVAGGRIDRPRYLRFCASKERDFTCGPQPEFPDAPAAFAKLEASDPAIREALQHSGDSYRDPRVRAVFVMAPVFGGGFDKADLQDIHIPVEIVVGQGDQSAPPATNGQRFAALIPGAKLILLPATVGHYAFAPECTAEGKQMLGVCHDAPGMDRGQIHAQVNALALDFFAKNLKRPAPQ
jgi:predicted dienelactone hydrolase